jgi:hypothetical protein
MNAQLTSILRQSSEVERIELLHALSIAKQSNEIMRKFDVSKEGFAKLMDFHIDQIDDFLKGSYAYDIKSLAQLEVVKNKLLQESIEKQDLIKPKMDVR